MGLFGKSKLQLDVEKILDNQETLLANQARFLADNDKIINTQKQHSDSIRTIIANQRQILANQAEFRTYLNSISERLVVIGKIVTDNQQALEKKIDLVVSSVYDLLLRSGPGPVTITVLGENLENSMAITFQVNLPPKSAPDVVSRKLTVKVGDAAAETFELGGEVLVKEGLEGPQDSTVEVSLVDVDDAGNESTPSTASGVLVDSFAPPQPGQLGVVVVGETFPSAPPVEEPPVEEPPVEEPPVEEPPVEDPVADEPAPGEDPGLPTDEENV